MDNLITTTLAIGLLSLVALFGVTYGSDAMLNYQAKLEAADIVADAQAIGAAWKSYARSNNGSPNLTGYCWGSAGATDLVTAYMGRLPTPPAGAADSTVNYYYPALISNYGTNGATTKVGPSRTPADSIALQLKSPRTCAALAGLASTTTANATATAIGAMTGDLSATSTRRPFDCIYVDSDSSGAPSQGDTMLFIYRVFDQNAYAASARSACS